MSLPAAQAVTELPSPHGGGSEDSFPTGLVTPPNKKHNWILQVILFLGGCFQRIWLNICWCLYPLLGNDSHSFEQIVQLGWNHNLIVKVFQLKIRDQFYPWYAFAYVNIEYGFAFPAVSIVCTSAVLLRAIDTSKPFKMFEGCIFEENMSYVRSASLPSWLTQERYLQCHMSYYQSWTNI